MTEHEHYEVNFFKPLSKHAKDNTKLILTLAIIWAVAVFGFHFILILVTTPTPEETLGKFESVYPQVVEDTTATVEMKQTFAKSILMVLGKNIALKDDHKSVLKEAISWSAYSLQTDSLKSVFTEKPSEASIQTAAINFGLSEDGFDKIMKDLLPNSLLSVKNPQLSLTAKEELPKIMSLYLTHNRSFLTDFNFLGFPFHYWYTAQFLLILFVVLCLIYALSIEKMNTKHNFVEET